MTSCECKGKGTKSYKQQEYWESMLKTQEERNDHLSKRRCEMKYLLSVLDGDGNQLVRYNAADSEKDACDRETCLYQELSELRKREQVYKETLCKAERAVNEKEEEYRKCLCDTDEQVKEAEELKKENLELMEANRKLSDGVEDLQLEYAQYKENISGPLSRQLDREKMKGRKLELAIQEHAKSKAGRNSKQLDELYALKAKLNILTQNLNAASEYRAKLLEEQEDMTSKFESMQEELVKLKLHEAEVIMELSSALKEMRGKEQFRCKCGSLINCNEDEEFDGLKKDEEGKEEIVNTTNYSNDDMAGVKNRPKTVPPASVNEEADGQAAFGEDETPTPTPIVHSSNSEVQDANKDETIERVISPTKHTPIVYEPDGEVSHQEE